jgi:hypothetical protein
MNFNYSYYFVFDVESIGLHGEGFAAAYAVFDLQGNEIENAVFACDPNSAFGDDSDRQWVAKNVPKQVVNCESPMKVRAQFLNAWIGWSKRGAGCFADCVWPVEANFLSRAVAEKAALEGDEAKWAGPYPIVDIMTLAFARRSIEAQPVERDVEQLPVHDPLADVRYSGIRLRFYLSNLES